MIRTHRWAALALLAIVTAGCAGTQSGSGVVAPSAVTSAVTSAVMSAGPVASEGAAPLSSTALTAPATAAPSTVASATGSAPSSFGVCPGAAPTDGRAVVQCLGRSLSDFWTERLHRSVGGDVVVAATAAQIPAACRSAITEAPAFTCQVDNVVYLTPKMSTLLAGHFSTADRPYALAVVLAHEFGHVVQADVHQTGYGQSAPAMSQHIEQQADCLSGVWANRQSASGTLDATHFAAVAHTLITTISDQAEVRTHGTPQERAAALAKGLDSGLSQDCALTAAAA